MPVLANPRHERFAQELAKGKTADAAYVSAGYRENRHNAATLNRKKHISTRVSELLERARKIEVIATERAIERLAISKERVLAELAKIGFSDIRKAVRWKSALVTEEDNPDGGEVLVIKTVVTNLVEIVPSDEIDDETAAAIAQVTQNINGGVTVKLHDKRAALVDIGKHLGMFPTKVDMKVEHRRHITDYTDEDLATLSPPDDLDAAEELLKRRMARKALIPFTEYVLPKYRTAEFHRRVAEQLERVGVHFRPADNARVARNSAQGGWDQVRSRLIGTAKINDATRAIDWSHRAPDPVVFSTCKALDLHAAGAATRSLSRRGRRYRARGSRSGRDALRLHEPTVRDEEAGSRSAFAMTPTATSIQATAISTR